MTTDQRPATSDEAEAMQPAQPDRRLQDLVIAAREKQITLTKQLQFAEERTAVLTKRLVDDQASDILRGEQSPTTGATASELKRAERERDALYRATELQDAEVKRCEEVVREEIRARFLPEYSEVTTELIRSLLALDKAIDAHNKYLAHLAVQGVSAVMPLLNTSRLLSGRPCEPLTEVGGFVEMAAQRRLYRGPMPTRQHPHPTADA